MASSAPTTKTEEPQEQPAAIERLMVALRIRPIKTEEKARGARGIVQTLDDKVVVLYDPNLDSSDVLRHNRAQTRQYAFDCAFNGDSSQEEVYARTTKPLVENVLNGYNATIFAYGATGAGKTFTMVGTTEEPGIMVRALNNLFEWTAAKSDNLQSYKVTMSYIEIYNETIRDLLNPSVGVLDLREDSKQGIQVMGLSEITTSSTSEVMRMLVKGNKARTVEPTAANRTSSRSHALLQVNVKATNHGEPTGNASKMVRTGRLFMIDLAGSERASQTQNRGKRLVEGAHINRSLLALGNCINALAEKGAKYVNFRDSKLTRLLKDALTGNCRTVMIAHISPASLHFEESRNTLAYADRAKMIRNKVKRNVMDVTYHVAQYQGIIEDLRKEIERLKNKITVEANSPATESEPDKPRGNIEYLKKLKEALIVAFQDQMSLRHRLLEVDSQALSLSMEFEKNTLVINEWEVERAKLAKNHELKVTKDNRETEKLRESDSTSEDEDDLLEPDQVQQAWDELLFIQAEQQRYLDERNEIMRQLVEGRGTTEGLIEGEFSQISSSDQRELLMLLCKVHELEIEKTEMQAETLLKEHELRRKDLMLLRYDRQRNLCDEIITRQRLLIDTNRVVCPQDLIDLYRQYQQEMDEMIKTKNSYNKAIYSWRTKTSTPCNSSRSTRSNESERRPNRHSSRDRLPPLTNRDTEKVFVKLPRPPSLDSELGGKRVNSVISLRSNFSNPSSLPATPLTHGTDVPTLPPIGLSDTMDRTQMRQGLQGINAVAARRKGPTSDWGPTNSRPPGGRLEALNEEPRKPFSIDPASMRHARSDDNISVLINNSEEPKISSKKRGSEPKGRTLPQVIPNNKRESLKGNVSDIRRGSLPVPVTRGPISAPNSPIGTTTEPPPKPPKPEPFQLPQHNLIFSL